MNAYLIVDINITDVDEFMTYVQRIPELIEKHSGRYIVQGEKPEIIEGQAGNPQHTVILEFPSRNQAQSFLSERKKSDLYDIWAKSTNSRILLVEGCI
jgi:uncharacterized protein (DUF1330 family)